MLKFQPIKSLANIIPINLRLRACYAAINALEARIDALDGSDVSTEAETLGTGSVVISDVVIDQPEESDTAIYELEGEAFDLESSEDIEQLKAYAESIGCMIAGTVKKADTIKEKIKAHIDAQD